MVKDPLKKILKTPKSDKMKKSKKLKGSMENGESPVKLMEALASPLPEKKAGNEVTNGGAEVNLFKGSEVRKRLKEESAFISQTLSLLHIPNHSKDDYEADDLVNDVPPEVKRQMRMKLQASMKHRVGTLGELHERLKMKLNELRGENYGRGKKSKGKKKLTKAEKKQRAREEKRLQMKIAKVERRQGKSSEDKPTKPIPPRHKVFNSEGKMVFSKFDFANGEAGATEGRKQKLDPKSALKKIQVQKEKLQSLKAIGKTDRVKSIEEKTSWNIAMEKSEGTKVKDDVTLLKKSIKKREQKKKSSKKKWDARKEQEEKRMNNKVKKRDDNIIKRKNEKKQNKVKKSGGAPGFR